MHEDGDATGGDDVKVDVDGVSDTVGGCPQMFEVEPLTSAIEVIVDVSQSMATQYVDHDQSPETVSITRWHMLATALDEWLPRLGDGADLDMMVFPSIDAPAPPSLDACASWVGPGLGTPADALLAELPPAESTFMQGANPTDQAFAAAQAALQRVDPATKRAIVLFTDGAPNCAEAIDPPALFDDVNDATRGWAEYALGMGVQTHVVAIDVAEGEFGGSQGDPIANHALVLQDIAFAGGAAPYFVATASDLEIALDWIVTQTRSCRTSVPAELVGSLFLLEIEDQTFYEVGFATCFGDAGFVFVDNDHYDTIEVCGAACDLFRATGVATMVEQCSFPE